MYKYFLLVAFDGCEAGSLLVAMTSRRPSRESNQHSPDKKRGLPGWTQWSEGHRATVEDQKRNTPGSSWSGTFSSISDGFGRTTFTLDSVFMCSSDQWFLMKWWNNFFSLDVGGMFIERALIGNWSEAVHYMVHTTWVGDISISIWCCGLCLCWGCPLHSAIADTL